MWLLWQITLTVDLSFLGALYYRIIIFISGYIIIIAFVSSHVKKDLSKTYNRRMSSLFMPSRYLRSQSFA